MRCGGGWWRVRRYNGVEAEGRAFLQIGLELWSAEGSGGGLGARNILQLLVEYIDIAVANQTTNITSPLPIRIRTTQRSCSIVTAKAKRANNSALGCQLLNIGLKTLQCHRQPFGSVGGQHDIPPLHITNT